MTGLRCVITTRASGYAATDDTDFRCPEMDVTTRTTLASYEAIEPANDQNLFGLSIGQAARSHMGANWIGTIDELAAFLAGAGPYHYYGCGDWVGAGAQCEVLGRAAATDTSPSAQSRRSLPRPGVHSREWASRRRSTRQRMSRRWLM